MVRMLRCVVILAGGLLAASASAQEPTPFDSDPGKLSYAVGAQMGKDQRDQPVEVRPELLFRGVADGPGESSIFTRRSTIAAAAHARAPQTALRAVEVRKITVSFKLHPSLLGGTYGQIPWVSPRVYQGVRGQKTVKARAGGIDSKGGGIETLVVKWMAESPTMVTVSPRQASLVEITVRKPGQSRLRMVYGRLSKTLLIKAVSEYGLLRLTITQL
jgi:hypothetical protein